jgi:Right handed beta helix region
VKTPLAVLLAALTGLGVLFSSVVGAAPASAATDPVSLVPTFSSVGVYWSPANGSSKVVAAVSHRPLGSTAWQQDQDLWFDGRALGGRPAEYRGSIVGLKSGTAYEVRLTLAGTSQSVVTKVQTWSEQFPVGKVVELPANSSKPVDIKETGSPTGYVLVTGPKGGPATIDVQGNADYDLRLTNSAYVIVRGLTLQGARHHGIALGASTSDAVHDIVIEKNSISGWGVKDASGFGTPMDSAIYSNTSGLARTVIQGNRISSPNTTSNSWSQTHNGTTHPGGPQGITLLQSAGNNVIRYNDIVGDATHHFNDGMGATANFSYKGFPGPDSDIYGNYIAYTWDDGVEAEGGGMNVRISGNYFTEVYHAFGMAAVSQGPLYAYRNVADVARNDATATYGQAMFKMGGYTSGSTFYGDGRVYLFHNTALKPQNGPENRKAIEAGDGRVLRNVVSRNNILRTGAPSGSYSISDDAKSPTNSFDHDLYNGLVRAAAGAEAHGIHAEPVLAPGWGLDAATRTGRFFLAAGSPGIDQGVPLPGFDDGWTGSAPDVGAQEAGAAPVTYGARAFGAAAPSGPAATPAPGTGSTPAPAPAATPAPPATSTPAAPTGTARTRTITVVAEADTMVQQAGPRARSGAAGVLSCDGKGSSSKRSAVNAYLRFKVTGLAAGERVTTASLSLRTLPVSGGTGNGPAVWRTANAKSVATADSMTWSAGRPSRTGPAPIGNFGAVAHDARVTTAVSGITGNGLVSLELAPESTNGLFFFAREAADAHDRPQLVLTVTAG